MIRLADFEGDWRIERRIEDARAGQTGRFEGTAAFTPDDVGLRYEERGRLHLGGTEMEASRVYFWRDDGDGVAVFFEDGRAFHQFHPGQYAAAAHWCEPDQYDVAYDFAGWPAWSSFWEVKGPRKDYRMTTEYTRQTA